MGYIPIGNTTGTVIEHQLGKSPRSESERIEVLFEDERGNRSWWHGYLHTDKTFDRTVEALEFLGWDSAAHQGDLMSLHATSLLRGATSEIVVEDASYQNNEGAMVEATRVAWVNGVGGRGDAMPEDEARAFTQKLRARVLARNGPRPSTGPGPARPAARTAAAAEPAPINDDDIPF